jgi:CheY-like chemotaxis protein
MNNEEEKTTGLVRLPSSALSHVGSKSLVQRGMQDRFALEEAEQWVKKGWELRLQERHEEGVLWYRKAVERGLASAQNHLAFAYECGKGVPKDDNQAAFWFRKAADQGDADSQFMLAVMYQEGRGVPYDSEQAVFWFRKSAEQDDAMAQIMLGGIYEAGKFVPQDYAQAAYWYRKVAAADYNDDVQFVLGQMYENGVGDLEEAIYWYRRAAENGYEPARVALATLRMVQMPEPSNPKPPSESERKYPELSREQKDAVLDDLKAATEQWSLSLSSVNSEQLQRILLVEDEQSIRDIVVPILLSAGFDCRKAATGQIAIDLLRSGVRINLVLSNLLLPEVDGFTLLLHVKHNYPRIPFVFVTAINDAAVRKEAMRNGADGFLQKPFEGDQLLAIVRSVLAKA